MIRRKPGPIYATRLGTYQQMMNVPDEKNSQREKAIATTVWVKSPTQKEMHKGKCFWLDVIDQSLPMTEVYYL